MSSNYLSPDSVNNFMTHAKARNGTSQLSIKQLEIYMNEHGYGFGANKSIDDISWIQNPNNLQHYEVYCIIIIKIASFQFEKSKIGQYNKEIIQQFNAKYR